MIDPARQTTLAGDEPGEGVPQDKTCDWCDDPAKHSFELMKRVKGGKGNVMGTGMYWYACEEHKETAERHTATPLPSRNKK